MTRHRFSRISSLLLAATGLLACHSGSSPQGSASTGGTGAGGAAETGGTSGGVTGGAPGGAVDAAPQAGNGGAGAPTDANVPAPADAATSGGTVTIGTPAAGAPAWSADPVTTGMVPAIVYPSDQTRFPRNIYRTLFQWRSAGYSQFRLTFDGPGTKVVVFTDGKHALCAAQATAACWEADEAAWSSIAGGNAGQTVRFTVDGLDTTTTPPTPRRSAAITIGFSKQNVEGAIFYWSTTSAGIRRANISAATPENYIAGKPPTTYASPADQVKCVACHVVSRDGKYMLAPVQAKSGDSLWVMEVTRSAPPNPLVKGVPNTRGHGFATISPDDANVVAAWGGKMWMLDRATGTNKGNLPLGKTQATHPDWSPDGTQLVFATASGDAPAGAGLATMAWSAGQWGAPQVIVPSVGASNLFPMHSPDGKWIAFSRGKGGHGDATAQLMVVPSHGGAPVALTNANKVVSNALGDGLTENNQPTWAPPGDYHWIAFNSQREYGVVLPKGTQQIWVAAVDLSKAERGEDPSYPAFRLQFQGLNEDNHRAFWTLDVRDTVPPPDAGAAPDASTQPDAAPPMCVQSMATCDPSADTCCNSQQRCDTRDDGVTYRCYFPLIL